MRRDLIIGVLVAILLHGGAAGLGEWLKSGPKKQKKQEEEKIIQLVMPPIEPDEPEKVEQDEEVPQQTAEFAPPMQTDVPQIAPPDSFVQQMQPPPPEGLKPNLGAITIPQGLINSKNFGELFDLDKLDRIPEARLQSNPIYPFEMRRAGISGEVLVGFIVDSKGDVQNPYVIRSSQKEFESAALQAVSKWKFRPGQKGGRAVNTRNVQVPITFNITAQD